MSIEWQYIHLPLVNYLKQAEKEKYFSGIPVIYSLNSCFGNKTECKCAPKSKCRSLGSISQFTVTCTGGRKPFHFFSLKHIQLSCLQMYLLMYILYIVLYHFCQIFPLILKIWQHLSSHSCNSLFVNVYLKVNCQRSSELCITCKSLCGCIL